MKFRVTYEDGHVDMLEEHRSVEVSPSVVVYVCDNEEAIESGIEDFADRYVILLNRAGEWYANDHRVLVEELVAA